MVRPQFVVVTTKKGRIPDERDHTPTTCPLLIFCFRMRDVHGHPWRACPSNIPCVDPTQHEPALQPGLAREANCYQAHCTLEKRPELPRLPRALLTGCSSSPYALTNAHHLQERHEIEYAGIDPTMLHNKGNGMRQGRTTHRQQPPHASEQRDLRYPPCSSFRAALRGVRSRSPSNQTCGSIRTTRLRLEHSPDS